VSPKTPGDEESTRRVSVSRSLGRERNRRPCLLIVHGDAAGELVPLERPVTVVGRGGSADLQLPYTSVSRAHARFELYPEGHVELTDLDSTNGTYVEGAPVTSCFLSEGDIIGIGDVEAFRFGRYDEAEAALQHDLYTTATRDGLTGVLNRRHLLARMRQEFELALRSNTRLCALMIDVDHFKRVNDEHGHAAGDAVLQAVAKSVASTLRTYDLFGRYGGEEFTVLLRHEALDEARILADRLRQRITEAPIPVSSARGDTALALTVSIGVAELVHGQNHEPGHLLAAADRALYRAKALGRNCVCVDERPL